MDTVNESITTADDGVSTANERLSTGGPGPEGQPDTVAESLSGQDAPVADDVPDAPDVPAHSAVKAEWVAYAVAQGADAEAAESSTKAELIEQYG